MEPITTSAYITAEGKLDLHYRSRFAASIACFPDTAGTITFEPHKNSISHNQRKYFYGVIVDILHAFFVSTGERPEEVKKEDVLDFIKDRFLFREKLCPIANRYIKVYISLSANKGGMTMEEFTEKKEAIQQWAMEKLNLDIPEPDKNWRMYKPLKTDK